MFAVRAFVDRRSTPAYFHYGQTLQLLQARLNDLDQTPAISDSTIMVVITLAQAAEFTGDSAAVANHVEGLKNIVNLRGGVRALNTHNNMQVKVCRVDLEWALLSGHRPYFLGDDFSWDCFVANRDLIQCKHYPHDTTIHAFAETVMDGKLYNVLRDLHAFSCLSNFAYQTTRKLSPELYNETMISILYRLTHLSFESDPFQEALRSGLLAVSAAIFMQRQFMGQSYDHLLDLYDGALYRLREATAIDIPVSILFWLTMLSHVVAHKELAYEDWRHVWLDEAISHAGIGSWSQAREMLKSLVWIDFIHDQLGKKVFESAMMRRLGREPRVDV
ncbi:hypothetical protein MMC13_001213 [Lambiella insularis]|nr:hypothetical protein [Lambiella insularis]